MAEAAATEANVAATTTSAMLHADGIVVSFGGLRAVDSVDLTVGATEAVGMVGPNGSGKTTFLNAVTGVVPAVGRLTVGERSVRLGRPGAIRRAGLARAFQTPQTFAELTCIENVLLADAVRQGRGLVGAWLRRRAMWARERERWARAVSALERVGLADKAEQSAGALSYGQQRLLELARSLVGEPKVLLLDEPSAGLDAAETDQLAELLAGVHADGLPLLLVDHKIDFVEAVCSRVVVLQLGQLIADGPPAEVWADERVIDAYLGRRREAEAPAGEVTS
jgi:branched-chain amino acid transport system ATP-binding protein